MSVDKAKRELQMEIVDVLEEAGFNGTAVAPTGIGKGFILVEALKRLKPKGKVWYLCDSEQNRDITFKKELKKWGMAGWINKINFMCYQTAFKIKNVKVDLVLADEVDFISNEYAKAFYNNQFKHKVLVSATLEGEKRKLIEKIAPVLYETGLQAAENQGLLNKSKYYLVNYLLNPNENEKYLDFNRIFADELGKPKPNQDKLNMLKIRRGQFLSGLKSSRDVCRKLLTKLWVNEEARIVIFCGLTEQADQICQYSYHSESEIDNLSRFESGEIRVMSVVGKINRGVNVGAGGQGKPINHIVYDAPTKSATKFLQRSGRGRRLGVDELLHVYFLIPYYKTRKGKIEPTCVKKWVYESTKSIEFKPDIFKF